MLLHINPVYYYGRIIWYACFLVARIVESLPRYPLGLASAWKVLAAPKPASPETQVRESPQALVEADLNSSSGAIGYATREDL